MDGCGWMDRWKHGWIRIGMRKNEEPRIVFLSKDHLEQEHSYRISTAAYVFYLDSDNRYIPEVSLTVSRIFCSS